MIKKLRVKEVAQAQGFNMSSLSRAANLSFNTVKKMWTQPNWDPKVSTLDQVAQVLGVTLDDLVERYTDSPER
jgi:DNA-binding Xre family transcriptional regulator